MNEEELAKLLLDLERTKKTRGQKRAELTRIGEFLVKLGRELTSSPERVLFNAQPYHGALWGLNLPVIGTEEEEKWLDGQLLRRLTSEYRELCEKVTDLEDQKERAGL